MAGGRLSIGFTRQTFENRLLADGAIGTYLLSLGFKPPFETFNLENPEFIRSVHREYVDAGAQVLLTNTFSSNPIRWNTLSGRDDFEAVNRAAVDLARAAVGGSIAIAGSVGPSGLNREGIESLPPGALVENFARQARVLAEAGANAVWLETFTNLFELKQAITACFPPFKGRGLIATVSVKPDGSLADGTALAEWIAFLNRSSADVIGINCSDAPAGIAPVIETLLSLATKPVALKLNAGLPEMRDSKAFYAMTPREYAEQLRPFLAKSCLKLVGGCCGTNPGFIRELATMPKRMEASNEKK